MDGGRGGYGITGGVPKSEKFNMEKLRKIITVGCFSSHVWKRIIVTVSLVTIKLQRHGSIRPRPIGVTV